MHLSKDCGGFSTFDPQEQVKLILHHVTRLHEYVKGINMNTYTIKISEEAVQDIVELINENRVEDVSAEISNHSDRSDLLSVYYTINNEEKLIRNISIVLDKE